MSASVASSPEGLPQIVLYSRDATLAAVARAAVGNSGRVGLKVVNGHIRDVADPLEDAAVRVIIVDIDARNHAELVSLQGFMTKVSGRVPVIVVTETFDDAVGRWFLQIKVADFLRKPVDPGELLRSCVSTLQASVGGDAAPSRIITFLPAAGGVGVTTLAIESASLLMRASRKGPASTCLVDLDFEQGACAEYLDIEARLNLDEVAPQPERLDLQLLEVMISKHASGLSVLAAPHRPVQQAEVQPTLVARLLDLVSQRFENVVIDLPRHRRPWTDLVLQGSSRVYLVTDMTVPGLRSARRIALSIEERLASRIATQIIVNRFEQTLLFGTGLRRADVERVLEGRLAGTVSNNYKLVREAIDRGVPLDMVKAGNPVSLDLKKIICADIEAASAARVA